LISKVRELAADGRELDAVVLELLAEAQERLD
jgi:hypothetical protein